MQKELVSFKLYFSVFRKTYLSTGTVGLMLKELANRKWFSVVCTLIDNDICHHSGQNVVCLVSPQQILTTVMTNIVVDKSTDNTKPLLICFFTTIFNAKETVYFRA